VQGRTAVASFDSASHNIFHFAYKVLVGWYVHLRQVQDSSTELSTACSVFETVLVNRTKEGLSDWQQQLLHTVLGSELCAEFVFAQEYEEGGFGLRGSFDSTVCFEDAVSLGVSRLVDVRPVTGTDNALFAGPEDAQLFRSRVFHLQGIPFGFNNDGPIVYIKRSRAPFRAVVNEEVMLGIIDNVSQNRLVHTVSLEGMSFNDQIRLLASAVILLAPHGAALANAIFLPTGAAVVELCGAKYGFELYHHVATNSGHFYFRYTASSEETVFHPVITDSFAGHSARACMDSPCQPWARDSDISVDPTAFRRLFREVWDLVIFRPPLSG